MNEVDKIFNTKWEDGIKKLDSNSIDLIVTSPPYNVSLGVGNKHKTDAYESYDDNMPYNDYLLWMERLFLECNRVLKRGGRLCVNIGDGCNGSIPTHVDFTYKLLHMFDEQHMQKILNECSSPYLPFKMMTTIVWNKNQIGASTAWGSFRSPSQPSFPTQFEFVIIVGKDITKHEGDKSKISISKEDFIRNSRALWTFLPETQMMKLYSHPAMFPEELPRRLIDQLSYEEDVVLDPFSGAGTTCAVAKKMNRHYIGFEMSEVYYKKSLERLSEIPMITKTEIDGKQVELPDWLQK